MGKRVCDLYPQVYAFENLLIAERDAARGKRGRPDFATFEYHLGEDLLALQQDLRDKTYRSGAYRRHTVREPKERLISAAPYRDRVVHHALTRIIEPIYERRFINDSFASRAGNGLHQALDRATRFALIRFHLWLCQRWALITVQQYEYAVERLAEVGRLVRAWQASTVKRRLTAPANEG